MNKLRKKLHLYDFRKECAKWVSSNIGPEHVEEFLDKYDSLNRGSAIGGFEETAVFLHMIERIKQEM